MRCTLFLHYPDLAESEIDPDEFALAQEAFGDYAGALHEAGVLVSSDILFPAAQTTTVTVRDGGLNYYDGAYSSGKESISGVFVLEVDSLNDALVWAEKCPAARWGAIEVRPTAMTVSNGIWITP